MLVMEMSNKKQQIPTIRFKGFTDTWEQRKLGELASFSKGAGYTKGDLKATGKPIILYGRLYTKYETVIENVDTFVDEKEKSVISAGNEIIVPASGETSEDISRASVVAKPGIILGGDLNIVKPNTEIDPSFLALTISNGRQQKELSKKAQGKSVVHLHNSDLKEVTLVYPKKEEQTRIGNFFKNLDNTIALHQRQLNNYKQQKKYMLQKMFPKDGEKVPEVRFDGFTEEWEQCNLGDVAMIKTGYPFNSEDFDGSGKYLVITNGNIQNDLAFVDNSLGNRIDVSDTVLLNNYELNIGDVLVTMDGTVGRTAKVICSNQIIAQRVGRLIAKDNSEFLYQSLNTGDFSKEMKKVSHGGTIKHISLTEISDYAMFVPATVEEQTKIGAFFKHLDDATDHHQQKVNGYQQLKNAMLQQMFV